MMIFRAKEHSFFRLRDFTTRPSSDRSTLIAWYSVEIALTDILLTQEGLIYSAPLSALVQL